MYQKMFVKVAFAPPLSPTGNAVCARMWEGRGRTVARGGSGCVRVRKRGEQRQEAQREGKAKKKRRQPLRVNVAE